MPKIVSYIIMGWLIGLAPGWAQEEKATEEIKLAPILDPELKYFRIKPQAVKDRKRIYFNIFDQPQVYDHFCNAEPTEHGHVPSLRRSVGVSADERLALQQGKGAHIIIVLDDRKVQIREGETEEGKSKANVQLTGLAFNKNTKQLKMTLEVYYIIKLQAAGGQPPIYEHWGPEDDREVIDFYYAGKVVPAKDIDQWVIELKTNEPVEYNLETVDKKGEREAVHKATQEGNLNSYSCQLTHEWRFFSKKNQ